MNEPGMQTAWTVEVPNEPKVWTSWYSFLALEYKRSFELPQEFPLPQQQVQPLTEEVAEWIETQHVPLLVEPYQVMKSN